MTPPLVDSVQFIELGGSGGQVVSTASDGTLTIRNFSLDATAQAIDPDAPWALAVPGVIDQGAVRWASNLGVARPSRSCGAVSASSIRHSSS